MKLGAKLKGFSDADLVEGGPDAERRARDDLRREQRVRIAMQSGKPELARSDLVPAHLGLLEHEPTGDFYSPSSAEQTGEQYDSFEAFIVERSGDVTFLERPASGAKSRAELIEKQARKGTRAKA